MTASFDDHPLFHRTAVRAALGAGAMGALSAVLWFRPGASAASPCIAAGVLAALVGRRRVPAALVAVGIALAAAADQLPVAQRPLLALLGAVLSLGLAEARARSARAAGEPLPGAFAIAAALVLSTAAGWFFPVGVRALAPALTELMPALLAWICTGALCGLWFAASSAPLHLAVTRDPVEEKLAELRAHMLGELRPLVDRVAAARRASLSALRGQRGGLSGPAAAALRAELDGLALAALELARRGADLARAAPASSEEELTRRAAELHGAAQGSSDPLAQASYRRAARTLEDQRDHLRVVRSGRDRIAARLHEEVAQLERARFSLVLLQGADAERSAAELELLSGRLRHSAASFEAEAEVSQEVAMAAAALRV